VHIFERDCSLQRRFQKVIEESPAPGISAELTGRMAATAVALARAIRYAGAGTVEFLLDVDTRDFYFLEMNTRIQVEHAVTELVTGLDLVSLQIELARGRPPVLSQADVIRDGAAIECRLYAENPAKTFFPSPGRLTTFRLPSANEILRIDSGYREGDEVTPYYDPLVAKIIARGTSREDARAHAIAALQEVEVDGIRTNRDFLLACLSDEAFVAGDVSTGFIDQRLKVLLAG
jgi:acetyl/propionyl-CoA carboxylase alpha subunit